MASFLEDPNLPEFLEFRPFSVSPFWTKSRFTLRTSKHKTQEPAERKTVLNRQNLQKGSLASLFEEVGVPKVGRHEVEISSQKLFWNYFQGNILKKFISYVDFECDFCIVMLTIRASEGTNIW